MTSKHLAFAAVFVILATTGRAHGQDSELKRLEKIISMQAATISQLEKKACVLTTSTRGSCTDVTCGTQVATICNGKDGTNGTNGATGATGATGANLLKSRIICNSSGNYAMKNCCANTYPGAWFGVWDGEQSPAGGGAVNYGVFCFGP